MPAWSIAILGSYVFVGATAAVLLGRTSSGPTGGRTVTGEVLDVRTVRVPLATGVRHSLVVLVGTAEGTLVRIADPPFGAVRVGDRILRGVPVRRPEPDPV